MRALVILVASLVGLSCASWSPNATWLQEDDDNLKSFSRKDVVSGNFPLRGFNGIWTSDEEFVFVNEDGLVLHNVITRAESLLLPRSVLSKWRFSSITPSFDLSKLLIKYDEKPMRLNQIYARYVVYSLADKTETDLADGDEIANCKWYPTRNTVVYEHQSSIYVQFFGDEISEPFLLAEGDPTVPITRGVGDWIYYETIFRTITGLWFSPKGRCLAYIELNGTQVPDFTYIEYGEPSQLEDQYPRPVTFKFPKAGKKIPEVSLYVFSVDVVGFVKFRAPAELGDEPILGSVGWVDEGHVAPMWMNRAQTRAIVQSCDVSGDEPCETVIEMVELNGWLEPDTLICSQSEAVRKRCFIKGHVQGWKRLIEIDMKTKVAFAVTPDGTTLIRNFGFDEETEDVFVTMTGYQVDLVKDPAIRHLYKVKANGEIDCITCDLLTPEGNVCSYATASFSQNFGSFAVTCNGPDPTFVTLFANGDPATRVFDWELNTATREKLSSYKRTNSKYLRVPVGPDGRHSAIVKMLLPPCYNPESPKKYPMILDVYGGPNAVRVYDTFTIGFADYLVQSRGVIYVQIDGRGSGYKGNDLLFEIKNKMGGVEVEDHFTVVKYLIQAYKFIDPHRIGVWGWSYGGYTTGMTLVKDDDDLFQGGISVAPATSFLYYAAIYTDRFTGTPQENWEAYEASDLNRYAKKMLGKKYMLIHGNADDNVHYQHGMLWAKSLQRAGVQFEQQSYPDESHAFFGVFDHLYEAMDDFWTRTIRITPRDTVCDK